MEKESFSIKEESMENTIRILSSELEDCRNLTEELNCFSNQK